MDDWRIEPLDHTQECADFSCGKQSLDDYLRRLATQYEKRNLGRTYVVVKAGEKLARDYYTLAAGAIAFKDVPQAIAKKLPKHPVPVLLLARLAVDHSVQGQGLGEVLLFNALERCLSLADELGIFAVEVNAIDQDARSFYRKYGFMPLLDDDLHLFLPIATIRNAVRKR